MSKIEPQKFAVSERDLRGVWFGPAIIAGASEEILCLHYFDFRKSIINKKIQSKRFSNGDLRIMPTLDFEFVSFSPPKASIKSARGKQIELSIVKHSKFDLRFQGQCKTERGLEFELSGFKIVDNKMKRAIQEVKGPRDTHELIIRLKALFFI